MTIVGAGPAGLAAADVLQTYGVPVVLVDEQPRPGGQIFRQPPGAFPGARATYTAGYGWGRNLVTVPERPGITFAGSTTALGVLHERADESGHELVAGPAGRPTGADRLSVVLRGPDGVRSHPSAALLVATGAYDMPVPMPGWTLPGVVMAGAAQAMVKSQKMVPPGPIVLSGAHPLLLVAADQLLRSGAQISELVFTRGLPGPREVWAALPAVPGHVAMLAELGTSLARLLRAGVRISTHATVTGASGTDRVEAVQIDRLGPRGRPAGRPRTVETATLVLGYGFHPSTELARQARCRLTHDATVGGWVVDHDGTGRTTAPGVYVAGEPTGVAGAEASRAEGVLAALSIVADLGGAVSARQWRDARRGVRAAARFSRVVQDLFQVPPALLDALATEETVVCRCERVSAGDLRTTLARNPQMSTVSAVKLECRAGMGPCQGRYCEASVSRALSAARGQRVDQAGYAAAHLPIKPVPVGELAALTTDPDAPASGGVR
ncbi:NAD(P)/FAD-dependent oxidoreductase [Ruania halotolerans]|uniref:FAD/NAD(P)-dependent oxidoreductase n=1 Tax=Ruania halotolerans TaxID=2897773 RepID=UPI001E313D75|nr:NAD(P)/FAD-dependent oxidoreductase [Ruania halotolerans]UFU06722.1 NAD(P)/FAD-dependent oxidoreductase [Ruania halotolerans]